jgi:hypothetical protein
MIAATAVIGVVGLPFAILFGEPYPWIMMPGFASAGGFDGAHVEQSTAAFVFHFPDGTSATVAAPALFASVPRTNYSTLTARFAPARPGGSSPEDLFVRAFPGLHAAERSRALDPDDTELRAWLRGQSARLFPRRRPQAVEVLWQRVAIDKDGRRRIIGSKLSGWFDL